MSKQGAKPARAKSTTTKKSASSKETGAQAHVFQAEVSRLLELMVHSVYSETEIFLRELISNAADACDKLRYEAITKVDLLGEDPDLKITVVTDKKAKTLTVTDNGVGMTHDELVDNLGTIARSGTRGFIDALEGDEKSVSQIGQFGVGFYSAFMVADNVEVISTRAGSGECWAWRSDGLGAFTVEPVASDSADWRERGTDIRLHIKPKSKEYLDPARIETIVKSYSDHIAFAIELIEGGGKNAEVRRRINAAGALWMRPKKEITAEQYGEFYGHVAHQFDEPAHIIHYKAEGRHEYTVLLFIPGERPLDLFDPSREGRIKLYVKRVFITDNAEVVPSYLRFMRGVIDSEDMPLNISREMLQNNPIVASISKAVTNRVLNELGKLADKKPDDFARIWTAFGPVLKEGLYEDVTRRDKLLELIRFTTTSSGEGLRSLKEYISDLKENQTAIYYITGDDRTTISTSPQLEGFKARGIEVLLLSDPVDHFWVTSVAGYDGKPFKSVTQGGADLDNIAVEDSAGSNKKGASKTATTALITALKAALGDAIADVRVSDRLIDSPVCLVAESGALDRGLERLLGQQRGGALPERPRVLEINPKHDLIASMAKSSASAGGTEMISDMAWMLVDQARILEGETVSDPALFAERLMRLMSAGVAVGGAGSKS